VTASDRISPVDGDITTLDVAVIGHINRHATPHSVTFCCFGATDTERSREARAEEGIYP